MAFAERALTFGFKFGSVIHTLTLNLQDFVE